MKKIFSIEWPDEKPEIFDAETLKFYIMTTDCYRGHQQFEVKELEEETMIAGYDQAKRQMWALARAKVPEAEARKPMKQIQLWLTELAGSLDDAGSALDALEERLEPVMNQGEGISSSGEIKEPPSSVPLAEDIRQLTRKGKELVFRIAGISERVDL